jgi:hypothetical protein
MAWIQSSTVGSFPVPLVFLAMTQKNSLANTFFQNDATIDHHY